MLLAVPMIGLGAAGAITAGLGFALGLEHKGWATAAALLVMRPTAATTQLRRVGRALAVVAGTAPACVVALLEAPPVAVAASVLVAVTGLAATRSSRWYVTGGFTTFITILLLIYGRLTRQTRDSSNASARRCWASA